MPANWYQDKVMLITGASSGIGRAAAQAASAAGARLILVARSEEVLGKLVADLGRDTGQVIAAVADVGDRSQVQQAVERALSAFGRIDIAVACAGIEILGPADTLTPDELQAMLNTNFFGLVHLAQAVVPIFRRQAGGTLAFVSSPMARMGFSWSGGYGASKAAGDAFALALRHELSDTGIRVMTIYPGSTATTAAKHLSPERIPPWHDSGPVMQPEQTARLLLSAVSRGRPIAVLGAPTTVLLTLQRLVPALADGLIRRIGKAPASVS